MIRERSFNPYFSYFFTVVSILYGTTLGCDDYGVVFKLDPAGKYTVLHRFSPDPTNVDGIWPYAGLTRDAAGSLYGTTAYGFNYEGYCYDFVSAFGCGVVFKVDAAGNYQILHAFNAIDGAASVSGLVRDAAGNLYGTTQFGGSYGDGVVFKLDAAGNATVLHSFYRYDDGALPYGTLIMDSLGNLYGTAAFGGAYGHGVVFKITLR